MKNSERDGLDFSLTVVDTDVYMNSVCFSTQEMLRLYVYPIRLLM